MKKISLTTLLLAAFSLLLITGCGSVEMVKAVKMPDWLEELEDDNSDQILQGDADKVRFVIKIAEENVWQKTGGPFAAAVFDMKTNKLVAVGVDTVVPSAQSWAHAAIIACARAQNARKTYDLKNCLLVLSCEPCAQCASAVTWSGVGRVLYAAPAKPALELGFNMGNRPKDWAEYLKTHGVDVAGPMLADEAGGPFKLYRGKNGKIY